MADTPLPPLAELFDVNFHIVSHPGGWSVEGAQGTVEKEKWKEGNSVAGRFFKASKGSICPQMR